VPSDPNSFDHHASRDEDAPCPHCGYNLRGLSSESHCPECGLHPKHSNAEDEDQYRESAAVAPTRFDQGRTLTDAPEAFSDSAESRGSTRRPACLGCGYDLSGHPPMGCCPECGRTYGEQARRSKAASEPLMNEAVILSTQWRAGIGMLLLASLSFAAFTLFSLYSGDVSTGGFGFIMVVILSLWAAGSCLAMPQTLDRGSAIWRAVRLGSSTSQLLWPVSMVLAWGIAGDVLPGGLNAIVSLLDFVAFVGFVALLLQLERMTREMALRTSAKRLASALWIVLPCGLLLSFLSVPTVANTGFVAAGALAVIGISILLLPMYTIAVILIMALIDLAGFGHWTMRHERFLRERPGRLAAKKSAVMGGNEWPSPADLDADCHETCLKCGCDLRGHPETSCPECGMQDDVALEYPARRAMLRRDEPEDDPGDIPVL
jgi:rubrerythrin